MTDTRRTIDVQRTAALARLTLTADEAARFEPQLANILAFIATLDEVDTSAVEPTSHVVPLAAPLREDTVKPGLSRDEVLAQAPRAAEGAFVVPKFVDGG
ncbi:MAG: Asp-tRNA(Asn)/Glu-tRNA(Gln) amidotransferase subunit GatC [Deltaproteobacteria bacterium]